MQLDNDSFSPVQWTPGTIIRMTEVPWDSAYRDVVDFSDVGDVVKYCETNSMTLTYGHSTAVLPGRPVRIDIPYDKAMLYNYVCVWNPADNNALYDNDVKSVSRYYFYFITDIRYVSPHATELVLQLDVWTTYGVRKVSRLQFGRSFLERGHLPMVLKDRMDQHGRVWLDAPESLELGRQLPIRRSFTKSFADLDGSIVFCWSSVNLEEDTGTADNPNLKMATGSGAEGLPNALNCYLVDSIDKWLKVLDGLREKPWATSGIQSVMLIPQGWAYGWSGYSVNIGGEDCLKVTTSPRHNSRIISLLDNVHSEIAKIFENTQYDYLEKLQLYPYCAIEITAHNGAPITVEPQLIGGDNLAVTEYRHLALPAPRVMWAIRDYDNYWNSSEDLRDKSGNVIGNWGEDLEVATGMTNFPQFSVLNDGYLNTIASQAHSLQYARENAAWARDVGLAGNQLAYDQSTATTENMLANTNIQTGLASRLTGIQNAAAWDSTAVNTAVGGLGVIGAAASGNVGGAIQGAAGLAGGVANTAISTGARSASTAASNAAANATAGNNAGLQNYMRDTNKAYSDMVTNGGYEQAIKAINARVQDAKITQPTISGTVGGDAFLLVSQDWRIWVKIRTIGPGERRRIGDYWLRYGYSVNRYINMKNYPLQVMRKYTYWKLSDTHIGGDMPEFAKQTIRGIFEKGVTVWSNADDIIPCDIYNNKPDRRDY